MMVGRVLRSACGRFRCLIAGQLLTLMPKNTVSYCPRSCKGWKGRGGKEPACAPLLWDYCRGPAYSQNYPFCSSGLRRKSGLVLGMAVWGGCLSSSAAPVVRE